MTLQGGLRRRTGVHGSGPAWCDDPLQIVRFGLDQASPAATFASDRARRENMPDMDRLVRHRADVTGRVASLVAERVARPTDVGRWDLVAATPLRRGRVLHAGDLLGAPLGPAEAARIRTGALLPPGADAVVGEEGAREEDGRVEIREMASAGENLPPAGEDVPLRAVASPVGVRLGARPLEDDA